jgi:flagellar export protein FliJ
MKKFDFRLSAALRLRETQLEVEQSRLQTLLADKQRLLTSLETLQNTRRESRSFMESNRSLETADLRAFSAFLVGSEAQVRKVSQDVAKQDRLIETQRVSVLRADRNVRLLAKLKEKQLRQWQLEMDRDLEIAAQEAWTSARHQKNLGAS